MNDTCKMPADRVQCYYIGSLFIHYHSFALIPELYGSNVKKEALS